MADDDEGNRWVGLTCVFVDGPRDGESEAFAIKRSHLEAPGLAIEYVVWPEGASGPTGQYVSKTIHGGKVRMLWRAFSPEESARYARENAAPKRSMFPGGFQISESIRAVPMVRAGDPSAKPGRITAVFVGGPKNRRSEEFDVRVWATDEPGVVRVSGFDVWPTTPREFAPGRYEPDTSGGGPVVPFIWREYTPDEREKRAEEIGYRETPPFN